MASDHLSDASPTKGLGPAGGGVAEPGERRPSGPLNHNAADRLPPVEDAAARTTPPIAVIDPAARNGGFGTLLEPALQRACGGRLSPVSWFRTDWQRGGALTGYASFTGDDGQPHPAVVKLPVPPCERFFLTRLQTPDLPDAEPVVPRVFAHGEALNGYDLAWVVMERLRHGPLGPQWDGREFDLLAEAVGRFYHATESIPRTGEVLREDWEGLLARSRQHAQNHALPHAQHWNKVLKATGKRLSGWLKLWHDRPITGWCHGDLHLGNAMTRDAPPDGPALLFDFAKTRMGHWVQDAIYFEHLFWGRPDRLRGRKLARQVAQARKRLGLAVDPDWARLADIYRALLAMTTPTRLGHDGDASHLAACLAVLERAPA